jgi:general secretion pathway protein G
MKLGEMHANRRGFTLIEILIVVIILGILAAIVIPQFSSATTSSKISGVQTTAQTLRGAVQLYYYQHNDRLPDPGSALGFWGQMTLQTDANGAAYTTAATSGPFGPYMQSIPLNALNNGSTVIDANVAPGGSTTTVCGWEYDYNSGAGNGMIHGTNYDGKAVVP